MIVRVMSFDLTNQPATFIRLMNNICCPYLKTSIFVFLDDILIYSKLLSDLRYHLQEKLQVLKDNEYYAKASKCKFGKSEVEYLGHRVKTKGM